MSISIMPGLGQETQSLPNTYGQLSQRADNQPSPDDETVFVAA